jgi:hypothetical protein
MDLRARIYVTSYAHIRLMEFITFAELAYLQLRASAFPPSDKKKKNEERRRRTKKKNEEEERRRSSG